MQRFDGGISSSIPFDEGTSGNQLTEENERLDVLHDLQVGIEHVEEMKEGLDLKEDRTNVVFKELLNHASCELYPDCLEFLSLNFLVKMIHVKVLIG